MTSPWKQYKEKLKQLSEANPVMLLDWTKHTTPEKAEARYALCLECPELILATKQCKKCGCFMALKTKLEPATCPLGKW